MKRLPRITRSGDFSAAWNDRIAPILDENFREARIQPGIGCTVSNSPSGASIKVRPSAAGSSVAPAPWDVTLATVVGDTSSWSGIIMPGTVANLLPKGMFLSYSVGSSVTYWKCKVSTDGRQISSAEILVDATPPQPASLVAGALPATVTFCFAISSGGAVYRVIGPGNPTPTYALAIVTDKTESPPPGVPGVDRWYNLSFS